MGNRTSPIVRNKIFRVNILYIYSGRFQTCSHITARCRHFHEIGSDLYNKNDSQKTTILRTDEPMNLQEIRL